VRHTNQWHKWLAPDNSCS